MMSRSPRPQRLGRSAATREPSDRGGPRARGWLLGLCTVLGLRIVGGATAQVPASEADDPEGRPVRVRVLGRDDGLPRPGVDVYVVDRRRMLPPPSADGWSVAFSYDLRALQVGHRVRTDPQGEADVLVPRGDPNRVSVRAGPPFVGEGLERAGDTFVLRVVQHEPFTVDVVDASGRPLARFPVALHAAGHEVAVGLSDAHGVAVLGVPPDFAARLQVAPAGWIGPHEGFPAVTTALRKERTRLVVPPFGTVRLRAVRAGAQARVRAQCYLFEPSACVVPLRDGSTTKGIELAPVALGQQLRGSLRFDDRDETVRIAGPQRAGECVVVDYDVDPPRCKLGLQVVGVDVTAGSVVRVAVHADIESVYHFATVQADGRIVLDPRPGLRGAHLRRVDLDLETVAGAASPGASRAAGWSASVAVARRLAPELLDLGAVTVAEHPPVAAGRVVDAQGLPVPGVKVSVEGEDGTVAACRVQVTSDAAGRFAVWSPLPRDRDGRPLRAVVSTTVRGERIAAGPVQAGAEVELTVPASAAALVGHGRVEARLLDLDPPRRAAVVLELVAAAGGEVRSLSGTSAVPAAAGGGASIVWSQVPVGIYTVRARDLLGNELWHSVAVRVEADGVCRDPGLALRCAPLLRDLGLQVVDAAGVPIAGARVMVSRVDPPARTGPSELDARFSRSLVRATDGNGRAALALRPDTAVRVAISAAGCRSREFWGWPRDPVVRLDPASEVAVVVMGLPPGLPRARVQVWLRHVDRERGDLSVRAPLGDGDVARLPRPVAGSYRLQILVTDGVVVTSGELLGGRTVVEVGDGEAAPFTLVLDDPDRARLRLLVDGGTSRR